MTEPTVHLEPHPLLEPGLFVTDFGGPLDERPSPDWLLRLLDLDADVPLRREETVRIAVRELLRHGGHKPTGRGKPAAEYLVRAVGEGQLGSINLAVDVCNVVSLHSGLSIGVIDLDRARPPFVVRLGRDDERYVFNASGQEMSLRGLVVLADAEGPCANPVKDSQRTKTHDGTRRTLNIVWGTRAVPGRLEATVSWYRDLLTRCGATTRDVATTGGEAGD